MLNFKPVVVELAKLRLGVEDILVAQVAASKSHDRDARVAKQFEDELRGLGIPRFVVIVGDVQLKVISSELPTQETVPGSL